MNKKSLILLITIVAFFLLILIKKNYFQENVITYKINFNNDEIITIYNLSDESVNFNFKLNSLFFSSFNDLKKHALKDASEKEDYIKFFNFIANSIVKNSLFNNWDISPLAIINSTGFALCGKQSALFGLLCEKAGYKAKLIKLDGHVICEIKDIKNKKILIDVSHKHLFRINNKPISYQDIINNPSYLTIITDSLNSYIANYSSLKKKYLEIFLSTENNSCENIQWKFKDTFFITLPPNSSFSLPYKPNYLKDIFPYNTKAKLKLYSKKNHEIQNNNLIIIDIEGKGKVKTVEKTFTLPEEREILKYYLVKNIKNFFKIKVCPEDTNFAIVYALNPVFTKLREKNEFIINSNKPLTLKCFKNKHSEGDINPIHIQWLNMYSSNILNFYRKHKELKIKKFIDSYPYVINEIFVNKNIAEADKIKIRNRLITIDSATSNFNLKIPDDDKIFITGITVFISDKEFSDIIKQMQRFLLINQKSNNYFSIDK